MDIDQQLERGKETVALRVTNDLNSNSDYATIIFQVVYVRPEQGAGNSSIGFYNNYYCEKHKYAGLTIKAHMSSEFAEPYGYKLVVSPLSSSISLSKAAEIVKTLRPLQKKLTKIAEQEGEADSIEEYMARICRVLNVQAFYYKSKNNGAFEYKLSRNPGLLNTYLRGLIKGNQERLGIKAA